AKTYGHEFEMEEHLIGGCAIDAAGNPLPEETLDACKQADAVLLGAVGGPKWDDPQAKTRPEAGLLGLRKGLGLFANLRPIQPHPALISASPLKEEKLKGVDFIVVRELTGGIYFGEPRRRQQVNGQVQALDTMVYNQHEIERVAHLAFQLAQQRSRKLTSVDKANVLESSRLWRETVTKVSAQYPDVSFENLLVDAAAMHLLTRPNSFDVILTANLFGDILTDEASILTGSLGNLPSASLGESMNTLNKPRGLYEPIHGSAPDIAGRGVANPIGTILSVALMLRQSFGLESEAKALEQAVAQTLTAGFRTADIAPPSQKAVNTLDMQKAITTQFNQKN
ncbi:MAG TPA: 3-isopropylmalate dehydrogenase, partial [Anaerolineales bacterium]|nr:3-isopropylmalate dehydrogenase [Anaerolineales bacterium]